MNVLLSTGSIYTYSIARCFDLAARPVRRHRTHGRSPLGHPPACVRAPTQCPARSAGAGGPRRPSPMCLGWPSGQPALIRQSVELAEQLGGRGRPPPAVRVGYVVVARGTKRMFLPVPGVNDERCTAAGLRATTRRSNRPPTSPSVSRTCRRADFWAAVSTRAPGTRRTRSPASLPSPWTPPTWAPGGWNRRMCTRSGATRCGTSISATSTARAPVAPTGRPATGCVAAVVDRRGLRRRSHLRATSRRSGRRLGSTSTSSRYCGPAWTSAAAGWEASR